MIGDDCWFIYCQVCFFKLFQVNTISIMLTVFLINQNLQYVQMFTDYLSIVVCKCTDYKKCLLTNKLAIYCNCVILNEEYWEYADMYWLQICLKRLVSRICLCLDLYLGPPWPCLTLPYHCYSDFWVHKVFHELCTFVTTLLPLETQETSETMLVELFQQVHHNC